MRLSFRSGTGRMRLDLALRIDWIRLSFRSSTRAKVLFNWWWLE